MNQKTPCLQMLRWKLHVRTSVSPRKSPFIVFITPSILNKNGGDRLRKTSISSIFEEEILENCRFWEVQTSGFGLCIIYPNYLSCFKVVPEPGQRNSFSKRLFVPQNTAYIQSSLLQARYIIVQLLDGVANSPQNTSANTAAGLSIFQILVYLALTLG